jgi:hypothetical protein
MPGKRHYYYLVAGLQDIALDIHKLIQSQLAFKNELKTSLHADDFRLVEKLFLPHDHANLLNLLQKTGKEFREKGNYTQEELEEGLREPAGLPAYMAQFIEAFREKEPLFPGMDPENELTTLFYDHMLRNESNEFLREWFRFDLTVRNIMTALNARKHKVDYEHQVIGSDERSESIRRSHARDFGLGSEIDYLEDLVNLSRIDDIQEREKSLDEFRWEYLEEATFFHYFTIERILAFVIRLGMVERWLAIDRDHGNELFKKLLKELQTSYTLPDTFKE